MDSRKTRPSMYRQVDSLAPKRLLYQIMLLQVVYYVIALALVSFYYIISGLQFRVGYVFSWEEVRYDTTTGWVLTLLWLLDTFFSVAAMTIIVGRSKLALDFTLTLHGINVLVTWLVSGKFPASLMWWGLQIVSILLMVALGTWTSQWRELRATFFESQSYEMVSHDNSDQSQNEQV
ncbi:protein Sys1p [Trichomonascus vanleenenianus]|uniref:Sys1p n=1 Tax=Trichomonascus vanleenenianus TaxID=2268995 RepID=UPI003ECA4FD4